MSMTTVIAFELVAFLRERWAETEARERARLRVRSDAPSLYWTEVYGSPTVEVSINNEPTVTMSKREYEEKFFESDPDASVLADLDAKRRIADLYTSTADALATDQGTVLAGEAKVRLGAYRSTLAALALPFANHPDYRAVLRAG